MIDLHGIHTVYPDGTEALRDLSLHIAAGESVALLGANGAGKSTLLNVILGLQPITGGRAEVAGLPLIPKQYRKIRSAVGMVFANPDDQLFAPTVGEDIAFGPANCRLPVAEIDARVTDALRRMHIEHLRQRVPQHLSGGEKRRAAIAGILAMKPAFILFDEPTALLDPAARRRLTETLLELPAGKLIATHDLAFAEQLCPRALILKSGRLVADGPTGKLLNDVRLLEETDLA